MRWIEEWTHKYNNLVTQAEEYLIKKIEKFCKEYDLSYVSGMGVYFFECKDEKLVEHFLNGSKNFDPYDFMKWDGSVPDYKDSPYYWAKGECETPEEYIERKKAYNKIKNMAEHFYRDIGKDVQIIYDKTGKELKVIGRSRTFISAGKY